MIQRFHDQLFQTMSPERRARKLSVMKALARASFNVKNKENEDPLNNNVALPCIQHSTPIKSIQVTDLDEPESEHRETNVSLIEETENQEVTVPQLVITKIYDIPLPGGQGAVEDSNVEKNEIDVDIPIEKVSEKEKDDEDHWKSLEVLDESAEYEFCRSLEQSKIYASTSSLLEEIEADLPSSYSLARPLNHTFHTLTSYRTITRLARMDINQAFSDVPDQRESIESPSFSKKQESLIMEATVQRALSKQAEKLLTLSKAQKFLGLEHLESERTLLLANLRLNAVSQELEKLKMLGEISDKENFGQVSISDIVFDVKDVKENELEKFICTATERENVQSTSIVTKISNGKLHFDEPFKFSNLRKDFVIYIELYKFDYKEGKKTMLTTSLARKLKKMTALNLNKSIMSSSPTESCGFVCVACAEIRLNHVTNRENGKCVLPFDKCSGVTPVVVTSLSLSVKTALNITSTQKGFLNIFKQTWHRRWYILSGYFLECWTYPEDQESEKPPVDSIYLPCCVSYARTVGMDVCIRPNSFVLSMGPHEDILFSADSQKQVAKWIHQINLTIENIRLWKPNV